MPNFMLVSLNARFLLKIDLICLAIMPVQAFSIFIFSCLPERNIDVRIDQLLYQKYDRAPNTRENIHGLPSQTSIPLRFKNLM